MSSVRFLPESCSVLRCAAEWGIYGGGPGSHRSYCWNTETSHSRHPLNSPSSSGFQLSQRENTQWDQHDYRNLKSVSKGRYPTSSCRTWCAQELIWTFWAVGWSRMGGERREIKGAAKKSDVRKKMKTRVAQKRKGEIYIYTYFFCATLVFIFPLTFDFLAIYI